MKSMTGFGKATVQNDQIQIDAEIKSVNQRFLDIHLRMPKEVNPYELAIRQLIKERLQRGRIEIYLNIQQTGIGNKEVQIHWELINQVLEEMDQHLQKNYNTSLQNPELIIQQLLNNQNYVEVAEKQEADEAFGKLVLEAVEHALVKVNESRLQEGIKIRLVLLQYSEDLIELVTNLSNFTEVYEQDYRDKFEAKLNDWLGGQVDEARLLTEMAILLEKGDIHEELDRLAIHIEKLKVLLNQEEPVGRELDFLIQEMNREVNTIGSKSSPIEIKDLVVQMKTILEKIREQIQNIE